MNFSLDTRAHSEIGLVRANNQDSAYVSPTMLVVADGMGGAAAGDLASSVAIREVKRVNEATRDEHLVGEEMLEVLAGALSRANDQLADLVVNDHSLEGMGTTVCGALFDGESLGFAHIGDSRAYLLRDGEVTRLTHDHSWVQSLVDEGKLTDEEAAVHPHRSLLMKVLNGQPTHQPDLFTYPLREGDRLLFCSDGLSGMTSEAHIDEILQTTDLDAVLRRLIAAAHMGGGYDNITIILADVVAQNDELDAKPAQVLGAASTVTIPTIDATRRIDLSSDAQIDRMGAAAGRTVPVAPPPQLGGLDPDDLPPPGLIDPDRYEKIRYSPQLPKRRRRWLPITIAIVLAVALLAGLGWWAGDRYVSSQYFIGPQDNVVTIYQGVPSSAFGKPFYSVEETTTIELQYLPPYRRNLVEKRSMRYGSVTDARAQTAELAEIAARCKAQLEARASASPSPAPVPSPEVTTSLDPSASATMSPTSTPNTPDAGECS